MITATPVFGPDEFAAVAAELGTGIMITVNAGTGTPEAARRPWIQYYKDQGVTVTYCEVGNKVYLDTTEPVYAVTEAAMSPAEYAAFFNACAATVRAVDPAVKVGMVGVYYPGWIDTWLMETLPLITARADFIAVHNSYAGWPTAYEPDDATVFRAILAAPDYIRTNMDATLWIVRTYASDQNKYMPIAVTEHATVFTPSDADIDHQLAELARNQTPAAALGSAGTYAMFIADPWISIANHINMYSPHWQAALLTGGDYHSNPVRTAFYHVFRLYAETAGGRYIPVTDAGVPVFDCTAFGNIPAITAAKTLVSSAVLAPSGNRVWLYVLNRDLERNIPARVVAGLAGRTLTGVTAETLNGPDFTSANTPASPDTVKVTTAALATAPAFIHTFPAHSLTRITFRLE
ncbi:MAG: alpha-L-arabinofuranosidase C-terminal domain-containing protein [Planctomycetota bacterium]